MPRLNRLASPEEIRQRRIDPMVDFAFKMLLGYSTHRSVLIFFLNSVLERYGGVPIVDVQLQNPYNERDFSQGKLTVVDVKATDKRGHVFQVEVQLVVHPSLPERMLYGWSTLFSQQLKKGQSWERLRPVTSIWLLRGELFGDSVDYHHRCRFQDPLTGVVLDAESAIHVLEVQKWAVTGQVANARDEWLKFLWEGHLTDLESLSASVSHAFEEAVDILKEIRDKEADYHRYLSRHLAQVGEALVRGDLKRLKSQVREQAKELRAYRQELDNSRQELARLQALLAQHGLSAEGEAVTTGSSHPDHSSVPTTDTPEKGSSHP
jgi:predicted transposase/invertase (TIGR01784 family)